LFRAGQDKRKRKGREGRRVGHTARSDHSGHDLPHTKVRERRVASSKRNKGSKEEGEGGAGIRKEMIMSPQYQVLKTINLVYLILVLNLCLVSPKHWPPL
jgi:hypothetical protein